MSVEEFSIRTYLEGIKTLNTEDTGAFAQSFTSELDQLKKEAEMFDDMLSIFLCWEDGISRVLHSFYSDEELIELHGQKGTITRKGDLFTLHPSEISFVFCYHKVYSPVYKSKINHQCIQC